MKKNIFLSLAIAFLSCNIAIAQHTTHKHNNDTPHKAHKNDIGIANSIIYLSNDKKYTYGFDIHYIRTIGTSHFGLGIAYEKVLGDDPHSTFGIVGSYRPTEGLIINFSPGIVIEDDETNFGLHFETAYAFDMSIFHIGPVISFSSDFNESHIGAGIHIGYGF